MASSILFFMPRVPWISTSGTVASQSRDAGVRVGCGLFTTFVRISWVTHVLSTLIIMPAYLSLIQPNHLGNFACWALTIQEIDFTIKHKSGKNNANANALSRCPADESTISAIQHESNSQSSLPEFDEFSRCQMEDDDVLAMILYLREGILPKEECKSRKIVLESKHFEVIEDVLYHENPAFPGRWCVVVPVKFEYHLLEEAHQGRFAGHLSDWKVYDRIYGGED